MGREYESVEARMELLGVESQQRQVKKFLWTTVNFIPKIGDR